MTKRMVVGLTAVLLFAAGCTPLQFFASWPSDFSGDHRADLVWIDNETGSWWQVGESEPLFDPPGEPGARHVPGNWWGGSPGTTTAWEPAIVGFGGDWITDSPAGTMVVPPPPGSITDVVPVPADYDGDGLTDPAWYSYLDATWHIDGGPPIQHGFTTADDDGPPPHLYADIPVPADYDNDGVAELATFSPVTATWHIQGWAPIQFGRPGDLPVPADYMGTPGVELAVVHLRDGEWRVHGIAEPVFTMSPGTIPAPADYDGDFHAEASSIDWGTGDWVVDGLGTVATLGHGGAIPAALPVALRESMVRVNQIGRCAADPADPSCPESAADVSDFDGDGTAELVWVDETGTWWEFGNPSPIYIQPSPSVLAWDFVAPGDYDGLPGWEPAYLPNFDTWATAGAVGSIDFAAPTPLPPPDEPWLYDAVVVPADYDGDGLTDPAWYRYTDAMWFIMGQAPVQFGAPLQQDDPWHDETADIPVPADYDGDGDADIATYSPLTASWNVLGAAPVHFGEPGGFPVPGDYDGDGVDELSSVSLRTPGTTWFIEGREALTLDGFDSFTPVPADYDGDGATEWSTIDWSTGDWVVEGLGVVGTVPAPLVSPVSLPIARAMKIVDLRYVNECWHDWVGGGDCEIIDPDATAGDFDGDGLADYVWIDEDGDWYRLGDGDPFFTQTAGAQWVPADYDGVGAIDAAYLVVPDQWITNGTLGTLNLALPPPNGLDSTLDPVPGDYDGDGDAEPAWYRYSDATWFVDGQAPIQFGVGSGAHSPTSADGLASDIPVPADYDGDGITDIAVYRPVTGEWLVKDKWTRTVGPPGAFPVPADYNPADPGVEAAVVVPGLNRWLIERTPGVVTTLDLGGDIVFPAPADYDGDGTADPSWIDGSNRWLTRPSSTSTTTFVTLVPAGAVPAGTPWWLLRNLVRLRYIAECGLNWPACD